VQGKVAGLRKANTMLTEHVSEAMHSRHATEVDSLAMATRVGYYRHCYAALLEASAGVIDAIALVGPSIMDRLSAFLK
jgi:hypothetical protein